MCVCVTSNTSTCCRVCRVNVHTCPQLSQMFSRLLDAIQQKSCAPLTLSTSHCLPCRAQRSRWPSSNTLPCLRAVPAAAASSSERARAPTMLSTSNRLDGLALHSSCFPSMGSRASRRTPSRAGFRAATWRRYLPCQAVAAWCRATLRPRLQMRRVSCRSPVWPKSTASRSWPT